MQLTVLSVRETDDPFDDHLEVALLLRNASDVALVYRTHSPAFPDFQYQVLTDAAWVDSTVGLCGIGMQVVTLPPGQEARVIARPYTPNRLKRLRIGLASASGDFFMIWSPVIDPATLRAGVASR